MTENKSSKNMSVLKYTFYICMHVKGPFILSFPFLSIDFSHIMEVIWVRHLSLNTKCTVINMYTACTGKLLNYSMLYVYQLNFCYYIYVDENNHYKNIWVGYPSVLHQTGSKILLV